MSHLFEIDNYLLVSNVQSRCQKMTEIDYKARSV